MSHDSIIEQSHAEQYETVERLKQLANSIRLCTRPIKGHTDPESIQDCWNELNYIADTLFSKSEAKRIAFRAVELMEIRKINNPDAGIAHLHIDYEQILANKGLVVGKPKDH